MKTAFIGIIESLKMFFNRISDKEAERVIKYYSQVFETEPDRGGATKKMKVRANRINRSSRSFKKGEEMMKRFFVLLLLLGVMVLGLKADYSYAGEVDILLQKLVEKGVLTPGEAQQIGTETKEQVKKEIAEGKYSSLPAWVQNTKLKGDFRLRYQNLHEKNPNDISKDTSIARIRMRLGLESKVNDKVLAGIGIATGSGDPRSTNITLGGSQSKKTVILDYAYGKYSPLPWMSFTGGKMLLNDVLWEPTDLIWDTDITPEGAVIGINKNLDAKTSVFLTAGPLVMVEENNNPVSSGAMAYLVEPGINYALNDNISLKGALTYEYFQMKDSSVSSYSKGQNTRIGGATSGSGSYAYNYSDLSPALEISVKDPLKAFGLNVESLKIFGEYVNNLQVATKNTGFSTGFQFGNAKVEKFGDWQFRYIYAMLEKDSVPDILPDSDRLSGKTGMRSHEGIVNFGLGKNTYMTFDVYRSWSLVGAKAPETLLQVDWNLKF